MQLTQRQRALLQRRLQLRQKQQQRLNSSVRYRSVLAPPPPSPAYATTTTAASTTTKQLTKRRLRLPPGYAPGISLARRYPQHHHQQQQQQRRHSSKQTSNYGAQAAYKASLDAFKRGPKTNVETVRTICISHSPNILGVFFYLIFNVSYVFSFQSNPHSRTRRPQQARFKSAVLPLSLQLSRKDIVEDCFCVLPSGSGNQIIFGAKITGLKPHDIVATQRDVLEAASAAATASAASILSAK